MYGKAVAVNPLPLGDELAEDALLGATVLVVDDVADFDEDGGWLLVNLPGHTAREYLSADDDTNSITLAGALGGALSTGTTIYAWDSTANDGVGGVPVDYEVDIAMDDGVTGDPLQASLDHALAPLLIEGIRREGSETVELAWDGDDLRVVNVLGKVARINSTAVATPRLTAALFAGESITSGGSYMPVLWALPADYDESMVEFDFVTNEAVVHVSGIYDVYLAGSFSSDSTGARQASIETNDGSGWVEVDVDRRAANSGSKTTVKSIYKGYLADGTQIRFKFLQNSGSTLSLLVTETRFSIVKIAN